MPAPKEDPVTIRGAVSTTVMRAGETATVQRTSLIDDLLAAGWVEEVHDGQ